MCSQASPQPIEVTELYLSTEFVPSRELCVNYLLINTVFCAVTRMWSLPPMANGLLLHNHRN